MSANKKKILVMADWYDPGFKAGGPIRSCVNFSQYMKEDTELAVLTTDRDLGDQIPYANITSNVWTNTNGIIVHYISPDQLSWKKILSCIQQFEPEFLYLNSLFSRYFTIYPLMMKKLKKFNAKIVLAPRGMVRESALQFKPIKKKIFISLLNISGLSRKIYFHATDKTEERDIKNIFGTASNVTTIANFPGQQKGFVAPPNKEKGCATLIFVGRIHPIKNLHFLLQSLQSVKASITLTVVASVENKAYWNTCTRLINTLPANITVTFRNDTPNHLLETLLYQHHAFVLPTQGENFGHAIFEALAAGRPVLISDQTPWRQLVNAKAGWDLPLDNTLAFQQVIEDLAAMTLEELTVWCKGAWHYCHDFTNKMNYKEEYLKLFN